VAELRETAYALDVARGPAAIARLASGRTDAWLSWGGMIWDFAPAKLLVEEAGGCVTSWRGDGDLAQGTALGTNGLLHGHALRALRAASTSDGSGPMVAAPRPVGAALD
jgi:3'-phosphoadenosine 5'-phosphosulfate (PAPS) 3'-phosphatase